MTGLTRTQGPSQAAQSNQTSVARPGTATQNDVEKPAASDQMGPPVPPSLPQDGFDKSSAGSLGIQQSPLGGSPYDQKLNQATERFSSRIQNVLGHDAMSLAEGKQPWKPGDSVSDAQRSALQKATTDYVQDIPLAFMSPKASSALETGLQSAGLDIKNVEGRTLRELGREIPDAAQDAAKDMAERFKEKSPTAYYGLMVGGLAAVGGVAYTKGTEPLEKLGIKPELSTDVFNDSVKVKAEASWKERFSDFRLKSTVSGQLDLNHGHKLGLSATGNFADGGFQSGHIDAQLSLGRDLGFSSRVGFDADGLRDASLGHQMSLGHRSTLSTQLSADQGGLRDVGIGYQMPAGAGDFSIRGQIRHNMQTDRTTAGVSALYSPRDNFNAALSLSHDSQGESRVGFGVTWRF